MVREADLPGGREAAKSIFLFALHTVPECVSIQAALWLEKNNLDKNAKYPRVTKGSGLTDDLAS